MYCTNKYINLTITDDKEITYFDGFEKSINSQNNDIIIQILKWFEFPRDKNDLPIIKNIPNERIENYLKELIKSNIIINDKKNLTKRNEFFYETYSSTLDIKHLVNRKRILIIGCGTIGTNVAVSLVKMGFKNIILIDDDVITLHSLDSQIVYTGLDKGKLKGVVLKNHLEKISQTAKIKYMNCKIENIRNLSNLFMEEKFDIIIDCFDEKSTNLQLDLIDFSKNMNINYITTGYYQNLLFVWDIASEFNKVKNYFLENSYESEKRKVFSLNKGVIVDSQIISGLITNQILNRIIYNDNDNKFLCFDKKNNVLTDYGRYIKSEYQNFLELLEKKINDLISQNEIELSLKKIKLNENIGYKKYDVIQFLKFVELIQYTQKFEFDINKNISNTLNVSNTSKNFMKKMDVFQSITNHMYQLSDCSISDNLLSDIDLVSVYSIKKIQHNIHNFISENKDKFFQVYNTRDSKISNDFYLIQGISEKIFIKLKKEIKNISKDEYFLLKSQVLNNKRVNKNNIKEKDFFDFRRQDSYYFGSKNKAIDFIYLLLNSIRNDLGDKFLNAYKNNDIIVDNYADGSVGKCIYLTNTKKTLVYSTFDGTYESVIRLLHEIGHFFSNDEMKTSYFYEELSIIKNEILAESIFINILKIKNIDKFPTELNKLQEVIRYKFERDLLYILDLAIFKERLDCETNSKKPLTTDIYKQVFDSLDNLDPEYVEMKNREYFVYNYLANYSLYLPIEFIISDLIVSIVSIKYGEKIFKDIVNGVIISNDWIENVFSIESIIDLMKISF
ncbi:ThiF family adenylyltransferase [Facklamia sp. P12945]|uniref:ThiF family adenylyltransferase n=1 Tax=unclassified Facklamia TaxID=2622293 RepID=UPI003D1704E3